jgi:hypothetical protein
MNMDEMYFICPKCVSENIHKMDFGTFTYGHYFRDIVCLDCDFTWREIFVFEKNAVVTPVDSM